MPTPNDSYWKRKHEEDKAKEIVSHLHCLCIELKGSHRGCCKCGAVI